MGGHRSLNQGLAIEPPGVEDVARGLLLDSMLGSRRREGSRKLPGYCYERVAVITSTV
jgi:hypothetical protein